MTKAAGILFLSMNGKALFLRRTATAHDFPGCWDFPGGTAEGAETSEQTAIREAREEVGMIPDGTRVFHTRTSSAPGAVGLGAPPVQLPVDGGAPLVPEPTPIEAVDFTTFLQRVTNEFTPELNDEHDGYAWAPVGSPPEPLHPGCKIALDRLSMNELDVARAIVDGRLISPQRYENMTLWAIRLTGTGVSFRPKIGEFVYRKPDVHLNPDALARWNGAPVILRHPKESLLNSEEFSKRVVGTVFLPYVSGDEAWGIVKIWDDDANRQMEEDDLSTSPGVNFRDFKVNRTLKLEDGSKVLIEGSPSLVDHIAICSLGVWDKSGEPTGIRSEAREDSAMADDKDEKKEEKREDAKRDDAVKMDAKKDDSRKDADAGTSPDNKLSHVLDAVKACTDAVGGLSKRMDAFEEAEKKREDARKDAAKKDEDEKKEEAEKTAADKKDAKKDDAEEKREDRKDAKRDDARREDARREDSRREDARREDARADSAALPNAIAERFAQVEAALKDTNAKIVPISDDDHALLADAWSRVDEVYSAFGQGTPRAMPGESSIQYRRRTIRDLQKHSPTWKDVDLKSQAFADDAAFGIVEKQVLAEAAKFARSPATAKPGELRPITRKMDGHTVIEYVGEPRNWMDQIAGQTHLRGEGRFMYDLGQRTN